MSEQTILDKIDAALEEICERLDRIDEALSNISTPGGNFSFEYHDEDED